MKKRIESAKLGRVLWLSLVEKYQINQFVYVIILPDIKKVYNAPALSFLPQFMKKRGAKKAIVLTFDEWVLEQQVDENILLVAFEKDKLEALIQFYCLYEFTSNIVIASLEQPAGRLGYGMIEKKGLTSEEIFAGIVYGLVD